MRLSINSSSIVTVNPAEQHIDQESVISTLKSENAQLKAHVQWLEKQLFGAKSEKLPSNQNALQASLFTEEPFTSTQEVEAVNVPTHKRKKRKPEHNRQPLPDHLERVEEYIEPDFDTTGMTKIGEERTEILEILPAKLYVRVLIRPKYANEEEVKTPQLPALPIPQGNAGASLLAHILVNKYLEHLPLYRQSKRFERNDLRLAPSTLKDWVGYSADRWLFILYKRMLELVLESAYIQADETPLRVLDKLKKGKSHKGYLWVYYSPVKQIVFFDYQKGRGREGPRGILESFQGHLQTDGYVAYQEYKDDDQITLLHCMAHARRKFHEALSNDKARGQYALDVIGKLYAIEKQCRLTKDELDKRSWYQKRKQTRQTQAAPILKEFKKWLIQQGVYDKLLRIRFLLVSYEFLSNLNKVPLIQQLCIPKTYPRKFQQLLNHGKKLNKVKATVMSMRKVLWSYGPNWVRRSYSLV